MCPTPEPDAEISGSTLVSRLMEPGPDERRYQGARAAFDQWLADGTIVPAAGGPSLYTYRIESEGRAPLTGIVGVAHPDAVIPHEQIGEERVEERREHLALTGLQVAPVLAVADIPPPAPTDTSIARARLGNESHVVARFQAPLPPLAWMVLADGHHRAAAARRLDVMVLVMLVSLHDPGLVLRAHLGEPAGKVDPGLVVEAARTGRLLPPKSTWFEPKPCAGLVMVRDRPGR